MVLLLSKVERIIHWLVKSVDYVIRIVSTFYKNISKLSLIDFPVL